MLTAICFIAAVGLAYYLGYTLRGFFFESVCESCSAERSAACRACLEEGKKWRDA